MSDFRRGTGGRVFGEFCVGDSWRADKGQHKDCEGRVWVIGAGVTADPEVLVGAREEEVSPSLEQYKPGVLVRCSACLRSHVLLIDGVSY